MSEDRLNFILPIEPIEERYSAQWWQWTREALVDLGLAPQVKIVGEYEPQEIRAGQFLDVYGTNLYKADQMQRLIALLATSGQQPATILVYDGWFPGIEAIAYIRDAMRRDIRLIGIFHAGTYDPHDFLTQSGMGRWADFLERSWMKIYDRVLVATDFHRNLLENTRTFYPNRIKVVPFPVYENEELRALPKKRAVVFPHRLAFEKQPTDFNCLAAEFREMYPGDPARFFRAKDICKSKADYYHALATSRVSFSSALQETFGIAMQESVNLGCVPIVPDRLSYSELFPGTCKYRTIEEAARKVKAALDGAIGPPPPHFHADMRPILKEAFL